MVFGLLFEIVFEIGFEIGHKHEADGYWEISGTVGMSRARLTSVRIGKSLEAAGYGVLPNPSGSCVNTRMKRSAA